MMPRQPVVARALVSLALCSCAFGAEGLFQPSAARVWDKEGRRLVWRDVCGNNLKDHQLAGGYEWERDSRCFLALGEAWVRGQWRGGLLMLAFPDGNVLHASWPVDFPKGHVFRIQYALTDDAAANSTNGLRLTVVATDAAGSAHTLVERVLKPGDRQVYDDKVRLDFAARQITLVHDNLGSETWDVVWMCPEGLVVPKPLRQANAPRPPTPPPPPLQASDLERLRRAIEDLDATFGPRYPRGAEFLARLDRIQARLAGARPDAPAELTREFEKLRREALIANPLVSGQPILFEVRAQYIAAYHAIDTL
jgi:hypothetical protein